MPPVALITGANAGLGFATAKALARADWTVWLLCRDPGRAAAARATIRGAAGHDRVHTVIADLAAPDQVAAAIARVREGTARLDALVANAGLMPTTLQLSGLGVELGWHASHLGHVQLALGLLPLLRASAPARIVHLAGLYHRRGTLRLDDLAWEDRPWSAGQAGADVQLARVLFAVELAERLKGSGVTSNAVHPGAVRTGAQDAAPWWARLLIATVMRPAFVSADVGARTVVRLVTDPDLATTSGAWFRRFTEAPVHALARAPAARGALWDKDLELLGLPDPFTLDPT